MNEQSHARKHRLRIVIAAILGIGFAVQCQRALTQRAGESALAIRPAPLVQPSPRMAFASPANNSTLPMADSLETRALRDPIAFFESLVSDYDRGVRDYTCVFAKNELVGGQLIGTQVMEAMFRENPFSIRLKWIENADKCSRVLYVANRWLKNKQQMAVVEPGAIAKLFVPYVMRPIHGADAVKSSRRTIDQFGFRNSLLLTLKYSKLAVEKGIADPLKFQGTSEVGGRPTLVFERRLPYSGEGGEWPDRVLIVHIDREMLLPTLCIAYADDAMKTLLGRYELSNVKLNINLADSVFTKEGMGL